jgi:hypothetical protein
VHSISERALYSSAALLAQLASKKIRVVALVREQTLRRCPGNESLGLLAVGALALGDLERQRKSEGIDEQMDLRGGAPA